MNLQTLILAIGGTVTMAVFGLLAGLSAMGIDRILAARMQARIGPPLRQPFLDMAKLMTKQNIVPANAIPWLFNGAPLVALAASITILLYLPMASFSVLPLLNAYGDLVLILYLLILPALAMVIGGPPTSCPLPPPSSPSPGNWPMRDWPRPSPSPPFPRPPSGLSSDPWAVSASVCSSSRC